MPAINYLAGGAMFSIRKGLSNIVDVVAPRHRSRDELVRASWCTVVQTLKDRGFDWVLSRRSTGTITSPTSVPLPQSPVRDDLNASASSPWSTVNGQRFVADPDDQLYSNTIPELEDTGIASCLHAIIRLVREELKSQGLVELSPQDSVFSRGQGLKNGSSESLDQSGRASASSATSFSPADTQTKPLHAHSHELRVSTASLAEQELGPCLEFVLNGGVLGSLLEMALHEIPLGIMVEALRFFSALLLHVGLCLHSLLPEESLRVPLCALAAHAHGMIMAMREHRTMMVATKRFELETELMVLVNATFRNLELTPLHIEVFLHNTRGKAESEGSSQPQTSIRFPMLDYLADFVHLPTQAGHLARESVLLVASLAAQNPTFESVLVGHDAAEPPPQKRDELAPDQRSPFLFALIERLAGFDATNPRDQAEYFAFVNRLFHALPPKSLPVQRSMACMRQAFSSRSSRPLGGKSTTNLVGGSSGALSRDEPDHVRRKPFSTIIPRLLQITDHCHPGLREALLECLPDDLGVFAGDDNCSSSDDTGSSSMHGIVSLLVLYADLMASGSASLVLSDSIRIPDFVFPGKKAISKRIDDFLEPAMTHLVVRNSRPIDSSPITKDLDRFESTASAVLSVLVSLDEEMTSTRLSNFATNLIDTNSVEELQGAPAIASEYSSREDVNSPPRSPITPTAPSSPQLSVAIPLSGLPKVKIVVSDLVRLWKSQGKAVSDHSSSAASLVLALTSVWRALAQHADIAWVSWLYFESGVLDADTINQVPFGDVRIAADFQLEMGLTLYLRGSYYLHDRANDEIVCSWEPFIRET